MVTTTLGRDLTLSATLFYLLPLRTNAETLNMFADRHQGGSTIATIATTLRTERAMATVGSVVVRSLWPQPLTEH